MIPATVPYIAFANVFACACILYIVDAKRDPKARQITPPVTQHPNDVVETSENVTSHGY